MVADSLVTAVIVGSCVIGFIIAAWNTYLVSQIKVEITTGQCPDEHTGKAAGSAHLLENGGNPEFFGRIQAINESLLKIFKLIQDGAESFLWAEYTYMGAFVAAFSVVLVLVIGSASKDYGRGAMTAVAFIIGSVTSIVSGYIGMKIAVYSNARTTVKSYQGLEYGFDTAFKAGAVMGFTLVSLGLLVLFVLICIFMKYWSGSYESSEETQTLYECIAGYGLGGSSIAMFGRVGGGIYTKAADVGADLAGKVEAGWEEDDPRNPAVIADNVGDNVGDIAGMGADLFGSFAEASCAALVLCAQSPEMQKSWSFMMFPLVLMATGTMVCVVTTFYATHVKPVRTMQEIEPALKQQLLISTSIMTPMSYLICWAFLPATFHLGVGKDEVHSYYVFLCIAAGLWSGLIIGYVTEYYTSNSYTPVKEVARACAEGGAAPNIIYGLALGYKSVIVPVFCLAATIYVSYSLCSMFGVAFAALGILSTLAIGLTIDAYGPICDNAGGIAEMAHMPKFTRKITDALDAAGNTTAAIGKGFAIASAALVSLALFGAFVNTVHTANPKILETVDILQPFEFAGLLIGAMIPYWFTALTMKSVGVAANQMVEEVRRAVKESKGIIEDNNHGQPEEFVVRTEAQFARDQKKKWDEELRKIENEGKVNVNGEIGDSKNDDMFEPEAEHYTKCIEIATKASLNEMIAPGCLVIFTPLVTGFLFGPDALAGLLAGSLVSSVQMAISASNSGGAWDNAKKYISSENLVAIPESWTGSAQEGEANFKVKKGSAKYVEAHNASVIGDTVGDPLKDTSGPALNIVMKLMAIISLVFASSFPSQGYLPQLVAKMH